MHSRDVLTPLSASGPSTPERQLRVVTSTAPASPEAASGARPERPEEALDSGSEEQSVQRPASLFAESHAPELSATRSSSRLSSEGGYGERSVHEIAMVSAVERAMGAFKAEVTDLTVRLQASEQTCATHVQRLQELELERETVLKTAEYLETQRASLADEVELAWAAHERDEELRLALQAALSDAQSRHASEQAAAAQELHRMERRQQELEGVHAETLAINAALRIEVERLRARCDDARAAAEADRVTLDTRTRLLEEACAESARTREALKGTLADLEDLSSWARAKRARLADALQTPPHAAAA